MRRARSARVLLALLVLVLACSPTSSNVNGTLRPNQRPVLEGRLWQDERCGEGANYANCCHAYDAVCLDFADYSLEDVRVDGDRVVALFHAQDGIVLAISDDKGETWRNVTPGSIGNLAGYWRASLYLFQGRVIVMMEFELYRPLGNAYLGQPYEIDLQTGQSSPLADLGFLSRVPAAIGADGAWLSASFASEDARGSNTCVAILERWKPGQGNVPTRTSVPFPYACVGGPVPASDDGVHFGVLFEQPTVNACFVTYESTSNSARATCVPWAQWAAKSQPMITAAYANERTEGLRVYAADGKVFVASPLLNEPIMLGDGEPLRTESPSGRSRAAGLIPVKGPDGRARFYRVQRDRTVEPVALPTSPCEGSGYSCFDPKNADIASPGMGDVHWVEPLGNGEFLVFYNHDLAPGINQVKQYFTVSRERLGGGATSTDAGTSGLAGYPRAAPAGPIGRYCAKRLACDTTLDPSVEMRACLDRISSSPSPGVEDILSRAAPPGCDFLLAEPGGEACLLQRGVMDQPLPDGGVGCVVGGGLTRDLCGSCLLSVAVTCTADAVTPIDCSAQGLKCAGTECRNECLANSPLTCFSGKAQGCYQGAPAMGRCDQLGMGCVDAAGGPAGFCVSTTDPNAALGDGPPAPACVGTTLVWGYRGAQFVDCTALGFLGCADGRCTP